MSRDRFPHPTGNWGTWPVLRQWWRFTFTPLHLPGRSHPAPGRLLPDTSLRTCCGRRWPRPCPPAGQVRDGNGSGRSASGAGQEGRSGAAPRGLSPVPTSPRHRVRTPRRGSDWSFMPAKLRRSRRGTLEAKRWQSLEERGSPRPRCPVLTRSQTCDPSFCKQTEPGAVGRGEQGPPSPPGPAPQVPKGAAGYHKAFGELAARETLLFCSSCAWHRDVPYHGRLYISSNHLCFHASLLRKDVKAVVPIASILSLKKTNMALLVPNALSIHTATGEKFLFMLLRRREATYRLLKSLCTHLQDNDWSPLASLSNEESLKEPLTSSQSDLEQSTLEPNSLRALPDGLSSTPRQSEEEEDDEEAAALVLSSSEGEPFAKPHSPWAGGPHSTLWAWNTTTQLSPLTTIIIIYLLLVVALLLSSGYIALRTLELEQQLAAAAAWPGLNLSQQYRTR
ncbi:GRAM domain-containing protein 2A-like isoform X7 [Strigops habroptila]|uniref:GRAM domain-containing protein 2A-like isoform X7 n=1 Tax=Strigops habroptila TaxID=2489341 RepID=UPI0011D020A5|nr:GRAM domain-containing protein 2A-like isoform X7 [Strigops habroptila]